VGSVPLMALMFQIFLVDFVEMLILVACKECCKRFKIKLNRKFLGIKLIEGYQTTCPFCGYVIYLGDISQVKSLLFWTRMLPGLVMFLVVINTRTLYMQERLIVVGGALIFVYVVDRISLWISGKLYDKLSKGI